MTHQHNVSHQASSSRVSSSFPLARNRDQPCGAPSMLVGNGRTDPNPLPADPATAGRAHVQITHPSDSMASAGGTLVFCPCATGSGMTCVQAFLGAGGVRWVSVSSCHFFSPLFVGDQQASSSMRVAFLLNSQTEAARVWCSLSFPPPCHMPPSK